LALVGAGVVVGAVNKNIEKNKKVEQIKNKGQ
jgi:hypothetical protein